MKKLVLFILIAVCAQPPAPEPDLLVQRIIAFEEPWDKFVRKLMGCPQKVVLVSPDQCNPGLGQLDRAAFLKARHAAAELFHLEEPKFE